MYSRGIESTEKVSISLDHETLAWLNQEAKRRRTSRSQILREHIARAMEDDPTGTKPLRSRSK
jgi:metal-responsive CopG/Arc/MetJ family transcriptional regulator